LGLLSVLPVVNAILLACLYNSVLYVGVFLLLFGVWVRFHRSRREAWPATRLLYDDTPDPAIHGLNLLR